MSVRTRSMSCTAGTKLERPMLASARSRISSSFLISGIGELGLG